MAIPDAPATPSVPDPVEVTAFGWSPRDDQPTIGVASWTQDRAGSARVEFSVDEGEWVPTPASHREAGAHDQIVVGLPYGASARWRVVVDDAPVEAPEPIVTPASPAPVPSLVAYDPALAWSEGRYLLTSVNAADCSWCDGPYWTVILDRRGRVVWANPTPAGAWTLFPQLAVAGDAILWDEQRYWTDFGADQGRASTVHLARLDGEVLEVGTPGLHHAFVQLPDGGLAWGSYAHGFGEALVEKAPGQADETVVWRATAEGWYASAASNGLFYSAERDSYLYSFYSNSTVVEVDRASGDSVWWAGDEPGSAPFVPASSQFAWQHGVSWTDAGTLLVSSLYGYDTSVLEYEVDGGALHLVWSDPSGARAQSNGGARRLPNGNTLHLVGTAGVAREVTADHVEAWRVSWGDGHLVGDGQWITDLYPLVD